MRDDGYWELTIADANARADEFSGLDIADVDSDGNCELVCGGKGEGAVAWFRPATRESGEIDTGVKCHVGLALYDIDGDGKCEAVLGVARAMDADEWTIVCYKMRDCMEGAWDRYVIDPAFNGPPHDILFADADGDGKTELVVSSCGVDDPGIHVYRFGGDFSRPWEKRTIARGYFAEGTAIADLDGDGRMEALCGPNMYKAPAEGPYTGEWTHSVYAPNHREMCRTALCDITGDGTMDILCVDSEFLDGTFSWFENRSKTDTVCPWVEHVVETGLVYCHTLDAVRQADGSVRVLLAEMAQGGWHAPKNHDARVILYTLADGGKTVTRELVSRGEGTHQARLCDIDGDGEEEIVGKTWDAYDHNPKVQIWKHRAEKPACAKLKHRFVDRNKPATGIDLVTGDLTGNGVPDIVCGRWFYENPGEVRHEIPYIEQAIAVYDIDGDGRCEVIGIRRPENPAPWHQFYQNLSSEIVWLRPIDAAAGRWECHRVGCGHGDWPHGCLVAPILPHGQLALILGYHSAQRGVVPPEIFEIPKNPAAGLWPVRDLAPISYGEEFLVCDVENCGRADIIAGPYWLVNHGDGTFEPIRIAPEGMEAARTALGDFNHDGRTDVVLGMEVMDYPNQHIPYSKVVWLENPENPREVPWKAHTIDSVRCAHSIAVCDIDADGEGEILVGEHDPFWPYRSRCRTLVYKAADAGGYAWKSYTADERFEHHCGMKAVELSPGRLSILSHGWKEERYLHCWELEE